MEEAPPLLEVAELARGISTLHEKGILHRDLKPSNIMVGDHGEVLVVDWGLSQERGSAVAGGQVVGILVDSVAEVVELRNSQIDQAPSIGSYESARYIQGVASRDEGLLIVVDLNKLLSEEEWSEMAMF